ncbi:MAG: hypothetical protein RR712_03480 [Terrisporobacter sp.]
MIKNKMARLVGSAMAAALMFSAIAPTIEVSASEVAPKAAETQEYNQELAYAIEEIRVVVDYLDNKDLANSQNREYVLAFATSAVERVRGMENEGHVAYINETANQLRVAIDIADRLSVEMSNIKEAFDNDYSREHKETVLGYLNGSLSEIVHSSTKNKINKTTLNNANSFLHEYADKLTAEIASSEDKQATQENIDKEQLNYAIEEINIAMNIFDNENLINADNYDRMIIFASTAVDRVAGMDQDNEYVKEIYRLSGEISSIDNLLLRSVMYVVECLQNASDDTKEDWINSLNEALTYAKENSLLNDATLRAAIDVLHGEAGIK